MRLRTANAFTLVEILIVVVILGILAAIVVPQLAGASQEAQASATFNELQKLRRTIGVYKARENDTLPPVAAGDGTWGPIVGNQYEYMLSAPINAWVGGVNSKVIVIGTGPDTAYQRNYGWIYNDTTGEVWAGGFDADDHPISRP